jgi:hypothetical protein
MCRLARCCAPSPKPRPPFRAGLGAAAVRRSGRKGPTEAGPSLGMRKRGFPPQQRNSGTRDAVSVTTSRI